MKYKRSSMPKTLSLTVTFKLRDFNIKTHLLET